MEQILNKIYLESNKMRFGDMYNAITDYFDDHEIDHAKYIVPSDPIGSETSIFVVGIFAALRTFKNHINQRKIIKKYIEELSIVIKSTNYIKEYYEMPSMDDMINSIKSYFNSDQSNIDNHKKYDDLLNIDSKNHYTYIFNMLKKLYSSYMNDTIIQLSVTTLAFLNTINNMEEYFDDNEILLNRYNLHLKELFIETGNYGVYDEPNYRGYIDF